MVTSTKSFGSSTMMTTMSAGGEEERVLVWNEISVLPEKAVGVELQAQRDLLALALGNVHAGAGVGTADQPADAAGGKTAALLGLDMHGALGLTHADTRVRSSTSLASLVVLDVDGKSPRGIIRRLLSEAARAGHIAGWLTRELRS